MKAFFKITFLICFLLFSCEEDPAPTVYEGNIIVRHPHSWRTNTNKIGISAIEDQMSFNGYILVPNSTNTIAKMNLNNGEIVNEVDYFNKDIIDIYDIHKYQNKAIIMDGWHNACLNMETMEFEWVKERHSQFERIWEWNSGIEDHFFLFAMPRGMGDTTNHRYRGCYVGDIHTGEIELLFFPDLGELPEPYPIDAFNTNVGGVQWIEPLRDPKSKDIFLIVYSSKQYKTIEGQISQDYMGLYNFSKREWIYARVPLGRTSDIHGRPIIENGRIYHTLFAHIDCRDLYTGEIIWRVTDSVYHSPSGFCMNDDKIIIFEEGHDKAVAAYFKNSGSLAWRTPSHGSVSLMTELNDVVYFTSTGDGRLHALDANTGEYLWRLYSPEEFETPRGNFLWSCYAFPGEYGEKGKIIANSYYSILCYEAIR